MKSTIALIICLFVALSVTQKLTGFICTLDGTCFAKCVEENIPVDSCKLECTTCDWK